MTYVGIETHRLGARQPRDRAPSRRVVPREAEPRRSRATKPTRTFDVWLSDDADRVPLKMTAHTELGDVAMDLTEYNRPVAYVASVNAVRDVRRPGGSMTRSRTTLLRVGLCGRSSRRRARVSSAVIARPGVRIMISGAESSSRSLVHRLFDLELDEPLDRDLGLAVVADRARLRADCGSATPSRCRRFVRFDHDLDRSSSIGRRQR